MNTYIVYTETPNGLLRVGPFRHAGNSVRAISESFHRRYPNAHTGGQLYIARKTRGFEGERLPMDPPAHDNGQE